MLDGKMLRGLTGTPMRRIALAKRVLAEAEPEPLTLANLTTKSLTDCSCIGAVSSAEIGITASLLSGGEARHARAGGHGRGSPGARHRRGRRGRIAPEPEARDQLGKALGLPLEGLRAR